MKNILLEEFDKFNAKTRKHLWKKEAITVIGAEVDYKPVLNRFSIKNRTRMVNYFALIFIVLLVGAVFVGKAFFLQIIAGSTYSELSNKNRIRKITSQPERGVIFDRNRKIIARNKPAFSVEMNTDICSLGRKDLNLCKTVTIKINEYIPIDLNRIHNEIDEGKNIIILSSGLQKEDLIKLESNINQIPSVTISTSPQRDYLYNSVFAHVVGYVGLGETLEPVIVGKSGIEKSYDNYISGVPGGRIVEVDALGGSYKSISEEKSIPGKDIILNLDLELQKKAYELLEQTVKAEKKDKVVGGAVIAQDPLTGGVLVLVSYPSFDPNVLVGGISFEELKKLNNDPSFPFYNRAVSASYPPGSTFKMITATAALEQKVISPTDEIVDNGFIQVGSYIFRNWKTDGHGNVNLLRALQVSNDTYFYTVGGGYGGIKGVGIENLYNWGQKFGLGQKSGIDIPGEVEGYMPDGKYKDWYLGDTYITSIGQGDVLTTPMQINNITSYFANGGVLYKPLVVKEIFGESPQLEVLAKDLVDFGTYNLIREGLKMAVKPGGTGYPLFDFNQRHQGIELGGKTGTSEYINSKGEPKTHAWFTVFGPFNINNNDENKQKTPISLTVFLEGGGSGSDDAAPIAKELLDMWFSGN